MADGPTPEMTAPDAPTSAKPLPEPIPSEEAGTGPDLIAEPFLAPFADVLGQAKRQYLSGDHEGALKSLEVLERRLALGEAVDPDAAADAMIYLGEIRYSLDTFESYELAVATFRKVLEKNPDQAINPYQHLPDVVGVFELVRQQVVAERAKKMRRPRYPAWGFAPFGIPQFGQRQKGRGALYATLQGTLAATSIGVLVHLSVINGGPFTSKEWTPAEYNEMYPKVQRERYGVQWPATFGFYVVWAVSVIDGRRHWAKPLPEIPTIGLIPDPRQPGVELAWQF